MVILLKITSGACLDGSGLKLIFHWKTHSLISFKSLLRLSVVVSDFLTVEKRGVSSANNLWLHCRLLDKSLKVAQDEHCPLRTTLCFRFSMKLDKRFNKFPEIPFCCNLWITPSCYTLSKAFDISRKTPLAS